jgi:hypothetical protein
MKIIFVVTLLASLPGLAPASRQEQIVSVADRASIAKMVLEPLPEKIDVTLYRYVGPPSLEIRVKGPACNAASPEADRPATQIWSTCRTIEERKRTEVMILRRDETLVRPKDKEGRLSAMACFSGCQSIQAFYYDDVPEPDIVGFVVSLNNGHFIRKF